jgi:hypothetical protein
VAGVELSTAIEAPGADWMDMRSGLSVQMSKFSNSSRLPKVKGDASKPRSSRESA